MAARILQRGARRAAPAQDPRLADASKRLAELTQQYANAPAFWTGSGETGLSRNDAQGYSRFLNDQAEYARLSDVMGGGSGRQEVRLGAPMNQPAETAFDPATGMDNSAAFDYRAALPASVSGGMIQAALNKRAKVRSYGQ